MKRIAITIFSALLIAALASARKLDNFSRVYVDAPQQRTHLRSSELTDFYYPLIIQINDDRAVGELTEAGAVIYYRRSDYLLADVPKSALDIIDGSMFVDVAAISRPTALTTDVARDFANVNAVHSSANSMLTYDGAGVVTGICDMGFDPSHIAFSNRLAMYSVYNEFIASREVYAPGSDLQTVADLPGTDDADETHGTHTTNIMAGGRDNNPYYGAAPSSTLAVSTSSLSDMALLCGIEDIIAFAKEQNKPAVINLSVGSYLGPHDGTDIVNRYIDLLSKDAIICFAAGNYGARFNCLKYDFTADDTQFGSNFDGYSSWNGTNISGYMDFWSADNQSFEMQFVVYDRNEKQYIYESDWFAGSDDEGEISLQNGDNDVWDLAFSDSYILAAWGLNKDNNRFNLSLGFKINPTETTSGGGARYAAGWRIRGKDGQHIDAYSDGIYSYFRRFAPDMLPGNGDGSISNLCCNRNVVSVGACNSRNVVPIVGGDDKIYEFSTSTVANWSAYGSTVDGRNLPLICAPGNMIVSAESAAFAENHPTDYDESYQTTVDGVTYNWIPWCGTSMSSPLVAGIIALWLQADPTLTVANVIDVMQSTARCDFADIADPRWGAGCIDAYAGLKYLLEDGVGTVSTAPDVITISGRRIVGTAPLTICDAQGRVYDASRDLTPGLYIVRTPRLTRKVVVR